MEEMDGDEMLAMMASLGVGAWGVGTWLLRGAGPRLGARLGSARLSLLIAPFVGLIALWGALATAAAVDVRTDVRYQGLFVAMGSVWMFVLPRGLALVGVSFLDDVLDRRNRSAALALTGTVVGLAMQFTGSNLGEGPSIWNTVATAVAGTGALSVGVVILALTTSFGDTIAVERDVASGARFAGWITASGLVLGRASAGDWVSIESMMDDLLRLGWPVLVLLGVAIALERVFRPTVAAPRPAVLTTGILPALGFVSISIAYVATLPTW